MWWKRHKWRLLLPLLAAALLAAAFWYGGSAPGLQGLEPSSSQAETSVPEDTDIPSPAVPEMEADASPTAPQTAPSDTAAAQPELSPSPEDAGSEAPDASVPPAEPAVPDPPTAPAVPPDDSSDTAAVDSQAAHSAWKDRYLTGPVEEGKPLPMEPQDAEITDVAYTCTLSVRCDTILEHLDWLDPDKADLVPSDGVIFHATEVTFYEGESVFNVLQREMKKAGIHMEFENTPLYNSAYIEGIYNLYEFDCGDLSGWMYRVNGWFPNYGCSRYQLQAGDVVEWVYTCDLGADVGGAAVLGD